MQRSNRIALGLVLVVVFLDWMGIGLVYPMFSSMLFHPECPFLEPEASNALRGWYLGVLLASMSIAQFFSGPVLGALSDQKGRKPLFFWSLLLGVIGYFLCMVAVWFESLSGLVLARLLVGVGAGNAAVASAAIADLSGEANKATNFGLYSMSCGIGFSVGPFLGGKCSEVGFYFPFFIAAMAVLLNLLLIIVFFRETNQHFKIHPIRLDTALRNVKKACFVPGLRGLFLAILIFCFGWSFYYEFLPVSWISDFHLNPQEIGFFFAYAAGWYALSAGLLIRPIVRRVRPQRVFFFALCALGLFLLLTLSSVHILWVWIGLPIANFLASLLWPTSTTMVSNWAAKDAQGEILGVLQSVQSAAFAFSPLAAGWLLGENPHMPMVFGGISMLLAALVVAIFLRKELYRT